ncbi:hypothetical protein KKF91_12585 [Myxococcota bacterium]|nr:hypothetical protein [Myxococcota bacterium]
MKRHLAAALILGLTLSLTAACGSDDEDDNAGLVDAGGLSGRDANSEGDCVETLPQPIAYGESAGWPNQVTVIYDPQTHTVTVYEGYQAPDTIVVDKNEDGSYLVTTGPGWTVNEVSHGEIINHENQWFEWRNAPAETELSVKLSNESGAVITLTFRYETDTVEVLSACR